MHVQESLPHPQDGFWKKALIFSLRVSTCQIRLCVLERLQFIHGVVRWRQGCRGPALPLVSPTPSPSSYRKALSLSWVPPCHALARLWLSWATGRSAWHRLQTGLGREAQVRWVLVALSKVALAWGTPLWLCARGSSSLSWEDRKETAVFIFFRKKTFRRFF